MFSLIRNEQSARALRDQGPQWTGEAWREARSEFKLHLYQIAAAQGVPFDVPCTLKQR